MKRAFSILAGLTMGWVLLACGTTDGGENALSSHAASSTKPSFTSDDKQKLEAALNSPDQAAQAAVLIPALRQFTGFLPKGAVVAIEPQAVVVDEATGLATAKAVVSGTVQGKFTVGLIHVEGKWLIYATEQDR